MSEPFFVGIDLGGTNVRVGLVHPSGDLVTHEQFAFDPMAEPGAVIRAMTESALRLVQQRGMHRRDLAGAGMGAPGPLSHRRGVIFRCANLPRWVDVPARELLAQSLGCAAALDNDANVAALAESWVGAGRDGGDMVLLTLGTGVGGGIIIHGEVFRGHFENAAELGHMIVQPDGLPCPCGQRGCLEQYASASALVRRVREAATPSVSRDDESRASAPRGPKDLDAATIVRRAIDGDSVCRRIWVEACAMLAVACVNIQHAINPERIVLGGGLSNAGDLLLSGVREALAARTWTLCDDQPRMELALLGDRAGIIGAARLAMTISAQ